MMTNTATLNTSNKNTNDCVKLKYILKRKRKTVYCLSFRSIQTQQSKTEFSGERERQRQRDRDRETETDRQRQTDRDRQTDRLRQRDRKTETDRGQCNFYFNLYKHLLSASSHNEPYALHSGNCSAVLCVYALVVCDSE